MRHPARFITSLCALTFAATAWAGGAKQPLSLTIAAPERPLKAGMGFRLLVVVKNTSHRTISLARSPGLIPEEGWRYTVEVRDSSGRLAPPSDYARKLRGNATVSSNVAASLKPGQSWTDQVTVTRLYDLSRPGKYTVSLTREVDVPGFGKAVIKSNVITVTVAK